MANTDNLYIIICKFNCREEPGPIILFVMNKSSNIGLYSAVLSCILAINLQMKNRSKFLFDSKEIT